MTILKSIFSILYIFFIIFGDTSISIKRKMFFIHDDIESQKRYFFVAIFLRNLRIVKLCIV